MREILSWIGENLGAIASVGTLVFAGFVFWEARSIRKADGIFRQNQAWNEFGHAVARLDKRNRVADLLLGKEVAEGLTPVKSVADLTPREAFLLMSCFNVVSSEFNGYVANALDEQYVMHSLTMTSKVVQPNKAWVFKFLKEYGYEESFRRAVAIVFLTDDDILARVREIRCDIFGRTRLGWVCRRLLPFVRRGRLEEHKIRALCEGEWKDESPASDERGLHASAAAVPA